MIRHIVLFETASQTESDVNALIEELRDLPNHINLIRSLTCGRALQGNVGVGLVVDVDSWEDLEAYRSHPAHAQPLQRLQEIATSIHVADIEVEHMPQIEKT